MASQTASREFEAPEARLIKSARAVYSPDVVVGYEQRELDALKKDHPFGVLLTLAPRRFQNLARTFLGEKRLRPYLKAVCLKENLEYDQRRKGQRGH